MADQVLPADVEYVRTTPTFTDTSVPTGLLSSHRTADHTWAVLSVLSGGLVFRFEDGPTERRVESGETQVIPPGLLHHVAIAEPVSFNLAFYRRAPMDEAEQ